MPDTNLAIALLSLVFFLGGIAGYLARVWEGDIQ
jgi:hypothetical protein